MVTRKVQLNLFCEKKNLIQVNFRKVNGAEIKLLSKFFVPCLFIAIGTKKLGHLSLFLEFAPGIFPGSGIFKFSVSREFLV